MNIIHAHRPAVRPEKGSVIAYVAPQDRGYVMRIVGVVILVERSLATPDGLCFVRVTSAYAYHPNMPECGRMLPLDHDVLLLDCEECAVIGGAE
jgi:hypothetical protein